MTSKRAGNSNGNGKGNSRFLGFATMAQRATGSVYRLRKHAEYQRVYGSSRKQFAKQMSYFFSVRPETGADGRPLRVADGSSPRVGLTVGKVMGKAVDRNRIKRRMRAAVRRNLHLLPGSVDVILHPRRSVIDLEYAVLEREIAGIFEAIRRMVGRTAGRTAGRTIERTIERSGGSR